MRTTISSILLLLSGLLLPGCSVDDITGTLPANRPPEVWLSIAPPEGAAVDYFVHVYWGGFDPDGNISHYEWTITNNEGGAFEPSDTIGDVWSRTEVKDSVFAFTADVLEDSSTVDFDEMRQYEFIRSHTFFIRSVDDRGAPSPVQYRSFTATNLSPVIDIEVPRSQGLNQLLVPPLTTFQWVAKDWSKDGEPVEPTAVRSILVHTLGFGGDPIRTLEYIRTTPDAEEWTDWIPYSTPGDSGKFWRPELPLAFGTYVFAVQALDEAGAISPVFDTRRNVRNIRVNSRVSGPTLILNNKYMGDVATSSTETTVKILNLPAGIPIDFSWHADASSYGGVVTGYRYGWDILDLSDPLEWDIEFTPFVGFEASAPTRTFFFGSHTFFLEVIDNNGLKSRIPIVLNIIPFTMERDLLLVDDWAEGTNAPSWFRTKGAIPSDSEHDAFWREVLKDIPGFNPDVDVWPRRGKITAIPITVLATYKTIIWNARLLPAINTLSQLEQAIGFNSDALPLLSMFMRAGGRVLLCGDSPLTAVIDKGIFPTNQWNRTGGPRYPLIFRYELAGDQNGSYPGQEVGVQGVGEKSFAYDECCVNFIDVAWGVAVGVNRIVCPVTSLRNYDAKFDGIRAAVPTSSTPTLPRLELRPEVAGPGLRYHSSSLGLQTDLYNSAYFGRLCDVAERWPKRSCWQFMYNLECLDADSEIYGDPIGIWTSRHASVENVVGNTGRSVVWGFSPVFFKPDQVREALNIILLDEWKLQR